MGGQVICESANCFTNQIGRTFGQGFLKLDAVGFNIGNEFK